MTVISDETIFSKLRGKKNKQLVKEITLNALSNVNPHIKQCELEVQRIIHLQSIANQLPDAFTNLKRVIKSHIPVVNAPVRIDLPEGQSINEKANKSKAP